MARRITRAWRLASPGAGFAIAAALDPDACFNPTGHDCGQRKSMDIQVFSITCCPNSSRRAVRSADGQRGRCRICTEDRESLTL